MKLPLSQNLFKGYPKGFKYLFFTQSCFNFSFYGLKAIFILYIIKHFSIPESEAISLFATLFALSYGMSLLGGWVADQFLGIKRTILLGGILQAVGISFLILTELEYCFIALSLMSIGSGFYKPALSTSVGMLYENPNDPEIDKAYSTFYIAMNIGALTAPLICGIVSQKFQCCFTSLLLILVTLVGGLLIVYEGITFKQEAENRAPKSELLAHPLILLAGFFALVVLLYFLFKFHEYFDHLMGIIAAASFLYLGRIIYTSQDHERKNLFLICLYILLFTLFCCLFEQGGSSLLLFFDKAVDRNFFGLQFPSAALLSLGPIFVLILSPILIWISSILEKKQEIDGLIKVGIGFVFTSLSFVILAFGSENASELVSSYWVIGSTLIQTVGELLIIPIGFSNVSRLSPPHLKSIMMSFWMMAIAYGHYFGGLIAQSSITDTMSDESTLTHYTHFFLALALIPFIVGGLLLLWTYYKKHSQNEVYPQAVGQNQG